MFTRFQGRATQGVMQAGLSADYNRIEVSA